MNQIILYCRAGFEKELAAEITDKAANLGFMALPKQKIRVRLLSLNVTAKKMYKH